jgi:hypothetical protein
MGGDLVPSVFFFFSKQLQGMATHFLHFFLLLSGFSLTLLPLAARGKLIRLSCSTKEVVWGQGLCKT